MGRFSKASVNWAPFQVCKEGEKPPYPRSLSTPEGLGDRLRFVAFAELQAHHAFALAADSFEGLPEQARVIWRTLAQEEKKHLNWLLQRMTSLGIEANERPLSLALWKSFDRCETPKDFAVFMANAEERGRIAGEKFYETLLKTDPVTAALFQKIAEEEQEHIRLAESILHLV
jgi:rubrerythrin